MLSRCFGTCVCRVDEILVFRVLHENDNFFRMWSDITIDFHEIYRWVEVKKSVPIGKRVNGSPADEDFQSGFTRDFFRDSDLVYISKWTNVLLKCVMLTPMIIIHVRKTSGRLELLPQYWSNSCYWWAHLSQCEWRTSMDWVLSCLYYGLLGRLAAIKQLLIPWPVGWFLHGLDHEVGVESEELKTHWMKITEIRIDLSSRFEYPNRTICRATDTQQSREESYTETQ